MASTFLGGSFESRIKLQLSGAPDLGSAGWDYASSSATAFTNAFANGTGLNQINKVFVDAAAVTTTYDLDAGTLLDPLGATLAAFSRICGIAIYAPSTNAAAITLGGDFITTKWLPSGAAVPIAVGGHFEHTVPTLAGIVVTASTGDEVTVTVTGTDAYGIIIIGS